MPKNWIVKEFDINVWAQLLYCRCSDLGFRFSDMFFAEQKLAIQVADINCVQINLNAQ